MIYNAVLLCAFAFAIFNPKATLPATVLIADWMASWALESASLYRGIPWMDAFAFYGVLLPTLLKPRPERVFALGMITVMLLAHVIFWSAWANGVVYGEEYKFALNYSFLAAVIALSLGGFDAWAFVGACRDGARRILDGASGALAAGKAALGYVGAKEEGA